MKINVVISAFFVLGLLAGCRSENKEDYYYPSKTVVPGDTTKTVVNPVTCDTANVTFSESVRPILDEHCMKCHYEGNGERPEFHDFNTFRLYAQAGIVMNLITHKEEPFMPKDNPKLSDCKINTIRIWIEKGMKND
jgi:hypothetical protein